MPLIMGFTLSAENAVAYLLERGVLASSAKAEARAELLGGGVSNVVVLVDGGGGREPALVVKQSLPKLRVEEDWYADQERIHRERAGIDYVSALSGSSGTGESPSWTVPHVVYEDKDNFLFVMTAAPSDGVNWKEQLLDGHIDVSVAGQVGRMLGAIHRSSGVVGSDVPVDLKQFEDLDCFVQLRIDPYHRATAAAHSAMADVIENEAQKMLPTASERRALVHGDFSPKNIIVSGAGKKARVFLLDFEVVHLGNPVFDLAFMLNHFTLKAIYRPTLAGRYCEAARSFWPAYLGAFGGPTADSNSLDSNSLEHDTVRQLGVLLLARIDGKSPAEYITDYGQKQYARELARSMLTGGIASLTELHAALSDRVWAGASGL